MLPCSNIARDEPFVKVKSFPLRKAINLGIEANEGMHDCNAVRKLRSPLHVLVELAPGNRKALLDDTRHFADSAPLPRQIRVTQI